MSIARYALLIPVLFLLAGGCARRQTDGASAESATVSEVPAPVSPDSAAPPVPGAGAESNVSPTEQGSAEGRIAMRLTDVGRERIAEARSLPADPRDSAFASARFQAPPLYPTDAVIGSLGAPPPGAAGSAQRFAASALSDAATVADLAGPTTPVGAVVLMEELSADLGGVRYEARVGMPSDIGGGEWAVPFRLLFEQQGVPQQGVSGELVVVTIDGQWYIADIQTTRHGLRGPAPAGSGDRR